MIDRRLVVAGLAAACSPQWKPQYDLAGAYAFAEFRNGNGPRCTDEFLASIEGSELVLAGGFPPHETAQTTEGTATLLGADVPIVVEASDRLNPATASPVDPEAWATADDGTAWRISQIEFGVHQSCTPCKDEVSVQLDLADTTCAPWPIFR